MKSNTISKSLGAFTLIGLLITPAPAGAWCGAMGGYPSFEAQAAAQRRAAEAARARQRPIVPEIRNQQSQQVLADQNALKNLGYYKGDLDGMPRSATQAAIADFRKANGLGNGTTLDAKSRDVLQGGKAITKEQNQQMMAEQKAMKDKSGLNAQPEAITSVREASTLGTGTLNSNNRDMRTRARRPDMKGAELLLQKSFTTP